MSKVTEINVIANEVIERDYTEAELAQREIDRLADEAREAELLAAEEAKAALEAAAKAVTRRPVPFQPCHGRPYLMMILHHLQRTIFSASSDVRWRSARLSRTGIDRSMSDQKQIAISLKTGLQASGFPPDAFRSPP